MSPLGPLGNMEGPAAAPFACDLHLGELVDFSHSFLQPPELALERRSEGETVLGRILRAIEDCPRCQHREGRDGPSRIDLSSAGTDAWPEVQVRVTCTHPAGGAWTCTYHADIKRKLLLLGDVSARKTELLRAAVNDAIPDAFRDALGAKILTRHETVRFPGDGVDIHVVFSVWDVAGHRFGDKAPLKAYFRGAKAILAVCDLAHERSVHELDYWLAISKRMLGNVKPLIAVRERSIPDPLPIAEARLAELAQTYGATVLRVTPADAHRIEHLFHGLGDRTIRDVFGQRWRNGMFA